MNIIAQINGSLNAALEEIGVAQYWAEQIEECNEKDAVQSNLNEIKNDIKLLIRNIEDHL